jgi:hypothetical protein
MKGMTGNRAIRILEWAVGTLRWAGDTDPSRLTPFERELLAKCREIEVNIPGYGRVPTLEVREITPKTKLVLNDGTVWEVESIINVDSGLLELTLNGILSGRQIIRKRPTTRIGYIKD